MNVFEIKFQSRHRTKTADAVETTLTYVGKYDDLVRLQDTLQIGSVVTSAGQCYGNLVSAALDQISPEIWQLTTLYRLSADGTEVVSPPRRSTGKKAAVFPEQCSLCRSQKKARRGIGQIGTIILRLYRARRCRLSGIRRPIPLLPTQKMLKNMHGSRPRMPARS